ncbi:MAG: hypothetical protein JXB47_03070 [Anaerolineae bacterium]|nr:hypothetical protein [Anaerolineae bacterium]
MSIASAELTIEIGYADLVGDECGRAALAALEAVAAAKAQRLIGLPAGCAEVTGMGKVTCQVSLNSPAEFSSEEQHE